LYIFTIFLNKMNGQTCSTETEESLFLGTTDDIISEYATYTLASAVFATILVVQQWELTFPRREWDPLQLGHWHVVSHSATGIELQRILFPKKMLVLSNTESITTVGIIANELNMGG
jgi:hypothetical protein